MGELGARTLPGFFLTYEAINQELPEAEVLARLRDYLAAMRQSLRDGNARPNRTPSGLIDGGAWRMAQFAREGGSLLHPAFSLVVQNLLAVAEHNACMGRIVAAPTAGASGVIPGAFLTVAELHGFPESKILDGLLVAGGIGELIALSASLSGSLHGCQAENGSASAMTAAALASLYTDDLTVIESAAAFALKNLLGLVCDPVAGLVEVPCVKRNVVAGINALACAEMALAGIRTAIPLDEVIGALAEVGRNLPSSLRETSLGGLAATPTACRYSRLLREE
ncbi:MAG: L-serine ammonia-lyase, iron-sulfur-dependent, subunit alpha [Methanocella sp.]